MFAIGLDIGTTSVCGVLIDAENGKTVKSFTRKNSGFVATDKQFEKIQDPESILDICVSIYEDLLKIENDVCCVGLDGQMHGIVYIDKDGKSCSPLYTWQDGRGDTEYEGKKTYTAYLSEKTSYKLASGYGSVTHFYNVKNGLVPKNAVSFCTIHDYVAARLAGVSVPLVHASDAASFGLFDVKNSCFDKEAIENVGLDVSFFPKLCADYTSIGKTEDGIDVFCAIGDNQASVIGSINDRSSVLVNVGTGSQITLIRNETINKSGIECRPYVEGGYIWVGSSLCGGRAFAILEKFFESVAEMIGAGSGSLYAKMDELMAKDDGCDASLPIFDTSFNGSREEPGKRASIVGLDIDNFTAKSLIKSNLAGIAKELYDYFTVMTGGDKTSVGGLVGSGNGVKKNEYMQKAFEKLFGMPLSLPESDEQAAFGACLFALVGKGIFANIEQAQKLIRYI